VPKVVKDTNTGGRALREDTAQAAAAAAKLGVEDDDPEGDHGDDDLNGDTDPRGWSGLSKKKKKNKGDGDGFSRRRSLSRRRRRRQR